MRKMRWNCDKDGCFNEKKRVRLGVFDDCFPGRIGLGDIDGIVEINGFCLMIEWKGVGVEVPQGQRIMFERLTKQPTFTVLVIEGDVEDMTTERVQLWFNAKPRAWMSADINKTKEIVKRWADWTQSRQT